MPKLLSQSKHEELESNSALLIRDQKERRAENAKKLELQENFRKCTVHPAKFLQHAKFSQVALFILRNFHPAALFMSLHTVHFSHTVPAARLKFCLFVPLLISSHFVLVTVNCFC